MNLSFELFLDAVLGLREHFHTIECHVCGFDEVYFQHPFTKKQIGFTCEGCNFVYVFPSEQVNTQNKTFNQTIHNQKHLQSFPLIYDYDRA